ncbi:hypothetical protein V1477_005726 [Vespula maculifrons]|uniref:Uncharacterized protein n=1 Tax=Vespula maculifrons TaxID=7453 RepID=A0ABD2CMZ9_VESMC
MKFKLCQRYTRLNEDKSNSNSSEVLQRIKIERYLESTSKKDIWISTKLNMIIKHLTSKMKCSSIGTSCFSSNPTIRSTWIVEMSESQRAIMWNIKSVS